MKNIKNIGGLAVLGTSLFSTAFAMNSTDLQNGLADWVSLVAEILSFVCLAVFAVYAGKFIKVSNSKGGEGEAAQQEVKVSEGMKNGIMTALVGIGICQAVIIVAQAVLVK